jgi:hypothetical protein
MVHTLAMRIVSHRRFRLFVSLLELLARRLGTVIHFSMSIAFVFEGNGRERQVHLYVAVGDAERINADPDQQLRRLRPAGQGKVRSRAIGAAVVNADSDYRSYLTKTLFNCRIAVRRCARGDTWRPGLRHAMPDSMLLSWAGVTAPAPSRCGNFCGNLR